jgi:hypothetical protein
VTQAGLAMSVQHVLDLPSKIGGNIIASLLEPHHTSRVLSITRSGGWINGNCGRCLECIDSRRAGLALGNLRYWISGSALRVEAAEPLVSGPSSSSRSFGAPGFGRSRRSRPLGALARGPGSGANRGRPGRVPVNSNFPNQIGKLVCCAQQRSVVVHSAATPAPIPI